MPKPLLWLAVGLALIAAGGLWIVPRLFRAEWEIHAGSPHVVGDSIDPFVYAGGELVRPVVGSAVVRLTGTGGTVRLSLESPEPSPPLSLRDGSVVGRSWELSSRVGRSADVWFETHINGDTGLGERRLPETVALLAGESRFDLALAVGFRLLGPE